MGEPGDRVRLAAARGVLDEVPPAGTVFGRVGQQLAHHVELVVARPDLLPALPAGAPVLLDDDPGVVLQDVGQAPAGEDALPEVVGLEAVGVGRVAGTVVAALVEGQEPRCLAPEMRAEAHLVVIDGEVGHAAPELEELLPRVAVAPVLLDRVGDGLPGQAVLQLEGCHRQPVDEEREVEGAPGRVAGVAELARHAEAVGGEALGRLRVAGRRRAVEEVDLVRPVLDPLAQHVDGPALADLALQAGEELAPGRTFPVESERFGHLGLGFLQEGRELGEIDAVLAVVVLLPPAGPGRAVDRRVLVELVRPGRLARIAGRTGEHRADPALEAEFGGVGGTHAARPIRRPSPGPAAPGSRGRSAAG